MISAVAANEDEQITVKLSLTQWRIVIAHVEGGIYRNVHPLLDQLYAQVNAAVAAGNERAIAAYMAELQAKQSAQASNSSPQPTAESQQEPAADDSTDSESNPQRAALH